MNETEIKHDIKVIQFIFYAFLLVAINIVFTLEYFERFQSIVSILQWGLYFYMIWNNRKVLMSRSRSIIMRSIQLFSFLYLLGIIISFIMGEPLDILLTHDIPWTICIFLPVGWSIISIHDYELCYRLFYKYSFLITTCCTIVFVNHILNPFGYTYDMNFSYTLLFPTLMHYSYYLKNKTKYHILLLAILESIMLILYGSRAAIVAISTYALLHMMLFYKGRSVKSAIFIICIGSIFYSNISKINDFIESQGIYSRVLLKLANKDESQISGRANHWDTAIDMIQDNPIIGYGLGGYYHAFIYKLKKQHPEEATVVDPFTGDESEIGASSSPAHSGFLDMILFFGIFIGGFLSIWILFSIFSAHRLRDEWLFEIILIFYSIYIVTNMIFGGGIFTKSGCAIYLFLAYKYLKNKDITYNTKIFNL